MRAWPVARSIFDVRDANERTTSWIRRGACLTLPDPPFDARFKIAGGYARRIQRGAGVRCDRDW